jgi:sterol desaturase/sphingolipid hydroxylase (fatty acid hydroxylase superfamily)
MNINPIILSVPLFFFLMGLELLIERWQKLNLYRLNDSITNINLGTSEQIVHLLFKVVLSVSLYEWVFHNFAFFKIEVTWSNYIILFIMYDLCYYWAHRMSHEINLFWGAHVVHHQSEEYNLSVALRQSWFQFIFTAPFFIPLALIGFDTQMLVWVGTINLTYQFWVHTELVHKMGFLELFMNTPSHHRVHHGRNEKYIDKNHAGVFIVWDRMFGTFQLEEEKPVYGITTPIASWNPIRANFIHYFQMNQQLKQTAGIWNKIRVMFNKPGWRPAELGGKMPIPPVERGFTPKYNTQSPVWVNRYAFFQYLLITIGALALFIGESKMDYWGKIIGSSLVVWAVLHNGAIFESRRWVFGLEFFRLFVTLGWLVFYLKDTANVLAASIIAVVILLICIAWLWQIRAVFGRVQAAS